MSYQVLARKYRPQRFSDVIGQEHVTRTLKNAIEQQRIAHGYIFSGHRGIGKTTIARILAMALNCQSKDKPVPEPCGVCDSCKEIRAGSAVDVIEIDAATNRGIDEIRELRDAVRYRPARDRYKIYILDEAHQITEAAFNALLKTLEEPPGHVVFMMATTQPEDIPQTIRSRCQNFSFHAVRFEEIVRQLKDLTGKEGIKADDDALALLAEAGDGSMRDALSLTDQAIASADGKLTADIVRNLTGSISSEIMVQLLQHVAANSSEAVLKLIDRILTEGQNPTHFARQLVRFLRNAILAKVAGKDSSLLQISSDERARVNAAAELFSEEDLTRFLQIMLRTHSELNYRQEQRFHLELGLLKMVHAQRLLPLEELLTGSAPARPATAGSSASPAAPGGIAARSAAPAPTRPAPAAPAAPPRISPFEADRARKANIPKSEMSSTPVVMGATAAAVVVAEAPVSAPEAISQPEAAPAEAVNEPVLAVQLHDLVVSSLHESGQRMLANMLDGGQWKVEAGTLEIKVAATQSVIDISMGPEPKKLLQAAVNSAAGRVLKIAVVSGGAAPASGPAKPRASSGPGGKSRAANDPIVQRMQEKFNAEIRSVIDQRDKK